MKNTSAILLVCLVVGLAEISSADRNRESRRRPTTTSATAGTDSSCPPRRRSCTKDCGTRGFMRSANGCEICACNPLAGCPAIECPDNQGVCPWGTQEDENGCRLCECKTSPRCSNERVSCMMECPLGFKNGPDGCPTCQCFDPATASQLPAPEATSLERRNNENRRQQSGRAASRRQGANTGGPAAAQLPAVLSAVPSGANPSADSCPPICMMHCPNGMKEDSNGCAICECNDAAESATPAPAGRRGGNRRVGRRPSRRRGFQCFRPVCAMYCPNGNKRDENGCTLCECQQSGDTPYQIPTSSSLQCPELRCHRYKKCAYGFVTDGASGCPSCTCQTPTL